jgi:hypothetical protein
MPALNAGLAESAARLDGEGIAMVPDSFHAGPVTSAGHASFGRSIITVDFTGMESGTDLTGMFVGDVAGATVESIDLVLAISGVDRPVDQAAVAAALADTLPDRSRDLVVVVGYCTSAVAAVHLAGELEHRGIAVKRVILLNPTRSSTDLIERNLRSLRTNLSGAHRAAPDLAWTSDPEGSLRHAAQILADDGRAAFADDDMDEAERDGIVGELTERYVGWLAVLAAALHAAPPPVAAPVVHIVPRDATDPGQLHEGTAPIVRIVECERKRLLVDDRVRELVFGLCVGE